MSFAPSVARPLMQQILELECDLESSRPNKASAGVVIVLKALEITTNCYRRNCVSSGQLQELEKCKADLEDLAA